MSNPFRSLRVRNAAWQILYVGSLAAVVVTGVLIARQNLQEQGILSGFGFLEKSTGWEVSFSLLPTSAGDPYWWFFLVGILNTLFLGITGLVAATTVGAVVGLARTSSNELATLLGSAYVYFFRNIPLILQVFFWYALITHLPPPRLAHEAYGLVLTSRGLYVPSLNSGAAGIWLAVLACFLAIVLPIWLDHTRLLRSNEAARMPLRLAAIAGALVFAAVALVWDKQAEGGPISMPELQGLNWRGGLRIPSEFSAMVIGMAIYGGAYIGEIVRGGFKAVGKGQVEAAQSLGLKPWHIFTKVRLPLALRAMLPILANQYVWLIKATTLGITVGFTDFVMIVALTINHSGQTLEVIGILMAGFLTINLSLAAVFNRINAAIALKGNQLRA